MATKSKSPVFPMPEPHHSSDYGFDPQFDYFQVLEEAKRYKQRESSTDTFHFTIKNNNSSSTAAAKNHRRRWWKNALYFFKSRWAHPSPTTTTTTTKPAVRPTSISGPIYITESLSGSSTPFRQSSGPLTPAGKGTPRTPYFSLRELNMDQQPHMISPLPIYLVT